MPADGVVASGRALRAGLVTSRDLVEQVLIQADQLDPGLGVLLSRFDAAARDAADAADRALRAGRDAGPLHGIPLAVKDIIATREGPTTAQSRALEPTWGGGPDAEVVTRLRAAGAVIVGKTTLAEFAMGVPDPGQPFPVPRNPWHREHWTGGSSSGTAAGVAAGIFPAGLGTDTGGSIRLPAAFCGITGLRPTFGRVPVKGCLPMAGTMDTIGPMARTAQECALLFDVLADRHPDDVLGAAPARPNDIRIGVADLRQESDRVAPDQPGCFAAALAALADGGVDLLEVRLPRYAQVCAAAVVTQAYEALAWHRDRFGARRDEYALPSRIYLDAAAGYSPADYERARQVRQFALAEAAELFRHVDVVLAPTTTTPAPALAALDPYDLGSAGCFHTRYWSLLGYPALAVPIGFTRAGLPLGMQVIGPPFADGRVLSVGRLFQLLTDWHDRSPAGL